MSYFSHSEDQLLGSSLGCGSDCNCGPCKSGMSGLDEWYEKEETDDAAQPTAPRAPSPLRPPTAATPQAESLKGWDWSRIGLGYYGEAGSVASGLGPTGSSPVEQTLLQNAVRRGIRNPRQLSNIIFFARYPARKGIPLQANEVGLIGEWRQIRERIVLPALRQMFGPGNGAGGLRRVGPPRRRNY